jgi:hypothetical protein
MSRCGEWNGTYSHIANYLIDKKNVSDKKAFGEAKRLIYEYTKSKGITGSFSDRVMYVRKNFSQFMDYLQNNLVN